MSAVPEGMRPALQNPNFALFWLAQAITKFGDPITLIGLAAITYQLTGSALYTSAAVLVASLPQATFGFFAGPIADRIGHRRAMIVADLARALLVGMIPVTVALGLPLAIAYVLVFGAGLCAALFNPARVSLLPRLLTTDRLVSGNAAVYATDRTVEILGALVGGILVATLGTAVFYVDALTFLVSGLLMTRVVAQEPPARRVSVGVTVADAVGALRVIGRSTLLRANTIFSVLAQLCIPVMNGLIPVLVFRRFSSGDTQLGAALFGTAEAAIAAGAVLGSVVIARIVRSRRKGRLVVWGFAACGLSLVAAGLAPTFPLLLLALVLTGLANVVFFVPNTAILQEQSPAAARGGVIGARISLLSLSWLPVALAAGALADVVDAGLLIGIAGAFTLLVSLIASRIPTVADVP